MTESLELTCKTKWEWGEYDEPIIIDTCPNRPSLALVASTNHVATVDIRHGKAVQSLDFPCREVRSASFHPSGRHILVGLKDKVILANVLVDGIKIFWEAHVDGHISDAKFNRRGTVFAVLSNRPTSGTAVVVYDFIKGKRICQWKTDGTFSHLNWGPNCTAYATSEDGLHLCKWDALSGTKLADFACDYSPILGYTVSSEGKAVLSSRNNTITRLNRDLEAKSTVQVDEKCSLGGQVCVSDDGLVFVSMQRREMSSSPAKGLIRIYSAIGNEYFDQPVDGRAKVMRISSDETLLTNHAVFSIQDRRGHSQYITSVDLFTSKEESADNEPTELVVSTSHMKSTNAKIRDLQSRVIEVEIMNDLELRGIQRAQDDELTPLRETYDGKTSELVRERAKLREERHNLVQSKQTRLKQTVSAHLREVVELEEKYKADILNEVTKQCRTEEIQKRDALRREQEMEQLREIHERELAEFRLQANQKLTNQRGISQKLTIQRDHTERQSKARIAQLEDEIDESIAALEKKFKNETFIERELAERLALENGILRRKIARTLETIDACKERVASLLSKEEDQQKVLLNKEEEQERLEAVRSSKVKDLNSKEEALAKVMITNQDLAKKRNIGKDRMHELEKMAKDGPLTEAVDKVGRVLLSTTATIEDQQRSSASMKNKIVELKESISVVKKKTERMENEIRLLDSTTNDYLANLDQSMNAILNPAELKRLLIGMQRVAEANENSIRSESIQGGDNDSRLTLTFLERMNKLEDLKEELKVKEAEFAEEKAEQIAVNATLLERISRGSKISPTRRRSLIFKR